MRLRTSLRRFGVAGLLAGAAFAGCERAADTDGSATGPEPATGPEEVAPVLVPAGTAETSTGRDPAATPEQPNPPVVTEDQTRTGAGVETDAPAVPGGSATDRAGDPLP